MRGKAFNLTKIPSCCSTFFLFVHIFSYKAAATSFAAKKTEKQKQKAAKLNKKPKLCTKNL